MDHMQLRQRIIVGPPTLVELVTALGQCTVADLPALRSWLNAGFVKCEENRSAILTRIEELESQRETGT